MGNNFYPSRYVPSVMDVDFEKEYQRGVRGVIFDIDNTLVPHNAPADENSILLFDSLRTIGLKSCLISNNGEERVKPFAQKVSALYLHKAHKPAAASYVKAMEIMGTTPETTLFVGDQIFTDIWGANSANIPAILVAPIDPEKEPWHIRLKRKLEHIVLKQYKKYLEHRNIVLIGFMGAGKTTVGRKLSALTGYTLLDTDSLIEQETGCKISEIFSTKGEAEFRRLETKVLKELTHRKHIILSTGGGLPMQEENRRLLRKIGFTVFLNVSRETVEKRLEGDESRPLLKVGDASKRIEDLLNQRGPIYDMIADVTVNTDNRSVSDIAKEIMDLRDQKEITEN